MVAQQIENFRMSEFKPDIQQTTKQQRNFKYSKLRKEIFLLEQNKNGIMINLGSLK